MMQPVALIMAGGTGGHVFPALAVARVLRERGIKPVWLGTARGMESAEAALYARGAGEVCERGDIGVERRGDGRCAEVVRTRRRRRG